MPLLGVGVPLTYFSKGFSRLLYSWTVFSDFAEAGYILITPDEKQIFGQRIQLRYHQTPAEQIIEIPDKMEEGNFL